MPSGPPKDQWMKWNAPSLQHLCADTESARLQNFRYIVRDNYWIIVTISINAGWEGRQCFFLPGRFGSDITVKHISEYSRQCSANILNIQCTQYDPKTCSTVCVQILLMRTHSTQKLVAVNWASCIETSIQSQKKLSLSDLKAEKWTAAPNIYEDERFLARPWHEAQHCKVYTLSCN